jgi:hypothetical protein
VAAAARIGKHRRPNTDQSMVWIPSFAARTAGGRIGYAVAGCHRTKACGREAERRRTPPNTDERRCRVSHAARTVGGDALRVLGPLPDRAAQPRPVHRAAVQFRMSSRIARARSSRIR